MTPADRIYTHLIREIFTRGELIPGRNGTTKRLFDLPTVEFEYTPLVTIRKTAWKKAIREMEWFLSGNPHCPDELLDWWAGQLNPSGNYLGGYGDQLRNFDGWFDQVQNLIVGIIGHLFSRRHVISTWNSADMCMITKGNKNPKTPTTCHTTIAQFFVSPPGLLSLRSYQRSADMLLGVPHNWIQSWALLLWVAEQTGTVPHKMLWTFGDAHIHQEPSHLETVDRILAVNCEAQLAKPIRLNYVDKPDSEFKASDFEIIGEIPAPIVTTKPKLL